MGYDGVTAYVMIGMIILGVIAAIIVFSAVKAFRDGEDSDSPTIADSHGVASSKDEPASAENHWKHDTAKDPDADSRVKVRMEEKRGRKTGLRAGKTPEEAEFRQLLHWDGLPGSVEVCSACGAEMPSGRSRCVACGEGE